jgi:hypothetical protein
MAGAKGEDVGDNTMKAIGTLPNEYQEAATIISGANEKTKRYC